MENIERVIINADIVILGGGAAGCQAAVKAKEIDPNAEVVIIEKAGIDRSGCLAAGVNAINAHLNEGEISKSFTDYVKRDSAGLIREDLTYTIGERLNKMSETLEKYGLHIEKDENGKYVARGRGSIKIHGENIKPVLANAARKSGAKIVEHVNGVEFIKKDGRVCGVYGFSIFENKFYAITAKAVICATGGAAGIYKPNNDGSAKHKMWYSPFNTGAGFAMGLKSGAEMTTFEMRFIALRIKDVISPTGTVAQGVNAEQINSSGEKYMARYEDKSTPGRLYATLEENRLGRGPCYLDITGVPDSGNIELKKAYLAMSPAIVLKWADEGIEPNERPLEICGSEPYIVGGHGQAGYWIDNKRRSTVKGLYAAGDVAGGAPKKYVTGAMAEAEIAVETALEDIKEFEKTEITKDEIEEAVKRIYRPLNNSKAIFTLKQIEERMQKIMDEYAGGISQNYVVNEEKLLIARYKMKEVADDFKNEIHTAKVSSLRELQSWYEIEERVVVARDLIEHLLYRKETRWKCYQQRADYPEKDDSRWMVFVNSVYNEERDEFEIVEREKVENLV